MERVSLWLLFLVGLAGIAPKGALAADHAAVFVGPRATVAAGPDGGFAVGPRSVVRTWGGGQVTAVGPNGYAYRSRTGGFGYGTWRRGSAAWVRGPEGFSGSVTTARGTRQISIAR